MNKQKARKAAIAFIASLTLAALPLSANALCVKDILISDILNGVKNKVEVSIEEEEGCPAKKLLGTLLENKLGELIGKEPENIRRDTLNALLDGLFEKFSAAKKPCEDCGEPQEKEPACPDCEKNEQDEPCWGCETPVVPEKPETPVKPEIPETPVKPEVPEKQESRHATGTVGEILTLVNQYRASAGLSAVTLDDDLCGAAQVRAKEIRTSFSHTRPDGTSCFSVLGERGISYRGAGENIAYGQSDAEEVMTAWMNSDGHRANILNASFTRLGVGVYSAGGTLYFAQMFTY